MENFNFLPIIVAGLIPMVVGAIYYGPVLGKAWMESANLTEDDVNSGNMAVTYGLSLVMAMCISFGINIITELTHGHFTEAGEFIAGSNHTFGHGAMHGVIFGAFTIIPALVIVSLFHKMSAKNIMINVLYWIITLALIGGVTDAWN